MPRQIRVTFTGPGTEPGNEPNVWVNAQDGDGGVTLTLMHDYPDLKPAAGWVADAGALGRFVVTGVSGRVLECAKEQGHE